MLRYAAREMASDTKPRNELRIIAGRWRGRRIRFPAGTTIRPTPDRVRETLFNWLAPHIRDAHVADLFAGSGALGLEALSRGAASALFVERDARCVEALRAHCVAFGAAGHEIVRGDAIATLRAPRAPTRAPFDIVFIDPPFDAELWRPTIAALENGGWLAPQAFVYLETPAAQPRPTLPVAWHTWREGKAGEVGYHLLRRATPTVVAEPDIAEA
jgi:16S rRNA (guanine966-N2)-methyltransferase